MHFSLSLQAELHAGINRVIPDAKSSTVDIDQIIISPFIQIILIKNYLPYNYIDMHQLVRLRPDVHALNHTRPYAK